MNIRDWFVPKWRHSDERVRRAAVEQLTNQAALVKVAKKDDDWEVRKAAVERLTNQAVLAEVAKKDTDASVRRTAVGRLTDQATLAEVAKKDADADVRKAAVEKLSHRSVIAEIATQDADANVVEAATFRILLGWSDADAVAAAALDGRWGQNERQQLISRLIDLEGISDRASVLKSRLAMDRANNEEYARKMEERRRAESSRCLSMISR